MKSAGCRVHGQFIFQVSAYRVHNLGLRVQIKLPRAWGFRFREYGRGFRVEGGSLVGQTGPEAGGHLQVYIGAHGEVEDVALKV